MYVVASIEVCMYICVCVCACAAKELTCNNIAEFLRAASGDQWLSSNDFLHQ